RPVLTSAGMPPDGAGGTGVGGSGNGGNGGNGGKGRGGKGSPPPGKGTLWRRMSTRLGSRNIPTISGWSASIVAIRRASSGPGNTPPVPNDPRGNANDPKPAMASPFQMTDGTNRLRSQWPRP